MTLLVASAANAQEPPPPGAPPESPYEVVADGLDNPRGLTFGPSGELYVAEAGRGGEGPCVPGPEGGNVCFGLTGAVTLVWQGEQRRLITGLPSVAQEGGEGEEAAPPGSSAIGPHDIGLMGKGNVYVIMGLGADPAIRQTFGPRGGNLGELLRLTAARGWRAVIDIAGYEGRENPDGGLFDSNPYSVLASPGEAIIVDAGANALLQVRANGDMSTLAVFPDRMVSAPPFLGLPPETQVPCNRCPRRSRRDRTVPTTWES